MFAVPRAVPSRAPGRAAGRSEGAKDAAIETAHAEGEALATLADQLAVDGVTQSAFMTSQVP